MNTSYVYKPVKFFGITFLITWISWFVSAYFSYQPGGESLFIALMIPGLIAPFGVALWMILRSNSAALKKQFSERLFNLKLIKPLSLIPMILLMPVVVVVSALISLLFGESASQLQFAEGFSFSVGAIPGLIILILAASFEELGWRSYAMDSLHAKFSYFKASLIFALLWAAWHLPLFFIKGYYHNEIVQENLLFGVNFMLSTIPIAFLINWVCKMNRSSILAAIVFHFFINMCQEALQITQVTKCIETGVLFLVAALVVYLNRGMFFDKAEEKQPVKPILQEA